MNTIKSSSKVLLSYLQYSCGIELEYSFHVIIMTYELAYSFYAMILTWATLCLTIHTTCMSRGRAMLRWRFIIPSGLPMSYACWSIGSESQGMWVVSLYTGVVPGYTGTFRYDGTPRLRVGDRWRQPYPSFVIPHVWVLCKSLKVSRACWQTSAQRSPPPSHP